MLRSLISRRRGMPCTQEDDSRSTRTGMWAASAVSATRCTTLRGRRGHGQEHEVHVMVGDDAREVVDRPGDRHAVDRAVPQPGVVVDHDHRHQAEDGGLLHLAQRRGAVGSRADDGDAHAGARVRVPTEREQPLLEPDHAEEEGGDDRPDDQHGEGNALGAPHEGQHEDEPGGGAGREQSQGFVDAGVAPRAAVAAPRPHAAHAHEAGDREEDLEVVPVVVGHAEVEAQREQQQVGEDRQHHIEQHESEVAAYADGRSRDAGPETPGRARVDSIYHWPHTPPDVPGSTVAPHR